jgi:hypothetical protein
MSETAEEISQQPDICKELQRATGEKRKRVKARGRDKFWFIVQLFILAGCAAAYFLLESKLIPWRLFFVAFVFQSAPVSF